MRYNLLTLGLLALSMPMSINAQVVTDYSKDVQLPADENVELYIPSQNVQNTFNAHRVKTNATVNVTFNYVYNANNHTPQGITIYNAEQKVVALDKGASATFTTAVPTGTYDMHALFKGSPVGNYVVFKEKVVIDKDTTLSFDVSEATIPIQFNNLNEEGTKLTLDQYENGAVAEAGNCTSYRSYTFFALKEYGVVHTVIGGTYRVKGYNVDYYVNKVSDRFSILHTTNMKSLINNKFYFIKFPETSLSAAASVSNNPEDLKLYTQQFKPTPKGEGEPNSHICAHRVICSYNGDILISAKNEYKAIILSDYVNEFYVDLAEPENKQGFAAQCSALMGDILVTGQYKHIIGVPVAGNKTQGLNFVYYGFDLLDGLVIPVGGGVSKVYPGHPVLSYDDKYPYVFGGAYAQLLCIKPKDYDGKSSKLRVYVGRHGEIIESGINTCVSKNAADGDFTNFTYTQENATAGDMTAKSELVLHNHAIGTEDYAAPTVQALRTITTDGKITDTFEGSENGLIEFAAADWKYHHDASVAANRWYDCSTIASVKVLYAVHESEEWNELEVNEVPEAFTMPAFGYFYRASTARISGEDNWYDLKVILEDPSGNVYTQTFWPAFFVSSTTGIDDVKVASESTYKVIENGQVIIVKGNTRYNIMGQEIK